MHYFIDGHNLIARLPDISLDDPNDEIKLVLKLQRWASTGRNRRVTVIFDGGLPGGKSLRFSNNRVNVVFASTGRTADSLLINRIQKVKNPPEYTLVSSDQEIIAAAKDRRMPTQRAEEFAADLGLDETRKKSALTQTAVVEKAEDPRISEEELAEWLELFGPVPSPKPARPKRTMPVINNQSKKEEKSLHPSLKIEKTADSNLTEDEVDEWLRFFDRGES